MPGSSFMLSPAHNWRCFGLPSVSLKSSLTFQKLPDLPLFSQHLSHLLWLLQSDIRPPAGLEPMLTMAGEDPLRAFTLFDPLAVVL